MTRYQRPARRGLPPSQSHQGPRGRPAPPPVDRTPPMVIHEDDAILVVDKPPGWMVVRAPGAKSRTLTDWVLARARRAATGRSSPKLKVVNELDAQASGLVVFAKTPDGFDSLKRQFRTKRPHRMALAIVNGHPKVDGSDACSLQGTVRRALVRPQTRPRRGRAVDKPAVTHYRLVRGWREGAALRLRLETSFPGQVDEHMRSIGCEIGRRQERDQPARMALHLSELGFVHPLTSETVRYSSRLPPDMAGAFGESAPARVAAPERAQPVSEPAGVATRPTVVAPKPAGVATTPAGVDATDRPEPESGSPAPEDKGWEHVAEWYDTLIGERRNDHFDNLIFPGVLRLLATERDERVLDAACGQGELCRALSQAGAVVTGVDASPALLEAARTRSTESISYIERDLRNLGDLDGAPFDSAACVMALMNLDPIEPVLTGISRALREGGKLVIVLLHPAFRQPGRSSWAWTVTGEDQIQQRCIRGYLSESPHEVVMNPGDASAGVQPICTTTHNRPIQSYVAALARAGFAIDALEEWASQRCSEPGPRANAENLARGEIPMFLAIRAIRLGLGGDDGGSGGD